MALSPADYNAWKLRNGIPVGGPDDPHNQNSVAWGMLSGEPITPSPDGSSMSKGMRFLPLDYGSGAPAHAIDSEPSLSSRPSAWLRDAAFPGAGQALAGSARSDPMLGDEGRDASVKNLANAEESQPLPDPLLAQPNPTIPADFTPLRQDLVDQRDRLDDGENLLQGVNYRQLTDQQRDTAQSLAGVIANTGQITPNIYYTMRQSGLRIGDALGPGIYQVEFMPIYSANISKDREIDFPPAVGANHSQYIYIDRNGDSHVLSAGDDRQHRIYLVRGSFDGNGPHSLPTVIGARYETMPIFNVVGPGGVTDDQLWTAMNHYADYIASGKFDYKLLSQNSNSFFYTLARHFGLQVSHARWTPGGKRDLSRPPRQRPTGT